MAKTVLKTKQLNQFREVLEEKVREIRHSMHAPIADGVVSRREEPNDLADLAEQSHEEWLFLNLNARHAGLLRQVEEALERLDEGTYTVCANCGKPISPKRLQAVPWAKYCIACAEQRGPWNN